ncbi:hypothetical protein [Glycomyces buryatensis]|uniref:MucR family transcriptional regulator n=1 Tax=Glycomyces buryatensis TaxID=2570927 RepID=A0A4V4HSG2_9ACTN|nr:hypothetical protein [Glycomyces buryatensis]THV41556.1 hypothetical protein FAB82_10630 [Glycomyces buryatensis]
MQGFRGKLVKGSEPEAVYWKRRAIVAGAVLALIIVVVVAVGAIGGDDGGSATAEGDAEAQEWATPSVDSTLKRPTVPSEAPPSEPSESASSAEPVVPVCTADDLMLQVVAAFDQARSGSPVPVSVLVASGADAACTADLGGVSIELAAGADVVYSSAHCTPASAKPVELEDGKGQTVEFEFDGLASEPGCAGDRRQLPAGDYELSAHLGEAASPVTAIELT